MAGREMDFESGAKTNLHTRRRTYLRSSRRRRLFRQRIATFVFSLGILAAFAAGLAAGSGAS